MFSSKLLVVLKFLRILAELKFQPDEQEFLAPVQNAAPSQKD